MDKSKLNRFIAIFGVLEEGQEVGRVVVETTPDLRRQVHKGRLSGHDLVEVELIVLDGREVTVGTGDSVDVLDKSSFGEFRHDIVDIRLLLEVLLCKAIIWEV